MISHLEESYRPTLCQKILRHYYFREIGEETVEFWKLRLQQTLGEIMPYYIQLWETTQVKYEKLWTRNYIEKYLGNENRTEDKTSNESSDYHDTATTSDTANTLTDFTDDAKTNIKQTGKTHDERYQNLFRNGKRCGIQHPDESVDVERSGE